MADVTFLLGRTGSGKSEAILTRMSQAQDEAPQGGPLLWVVPGDASFATEQRMLARMSSTLRAQVVTLPRLASMIHRAARPTAPDVINLTGQRLVLADVYQHRLPELQVLRKPRLSVGFLDSILEVFETFSSHRVVPAQLGTMLQVAATRLEDLSDKAQVHRGQRMIGKLHDLCVLYVDWSRAVTAQGFALPEDTMHQVLSALDDWTAMSDTQVFFDGFDTLTPLERSFVVQLCTRAKKATVALQVDPSWLRGLDSTQTEPIILGASDRQPPFSRRVCNLLDTLALTDHPGEVFAVQTLQLLLDMTQDLTDLGTDYELISCSKDLTQGTQRSDLAHLERVWFSETAVVDMEAADHVHLIAAANPRLEAQAVAREIHRLVADQQMAYADMTVMAPTAASYGHYLRDAFRLYHIPHYIDDFPSLATHPLAAWILTIFEAVQAEASLETMIRLGKTEFSGLTRDEVDWLEVYVRHHEMDGYAAWASDPAWLHATIERQRDQPHPDDVYADRLRCKLVAGFAPFYDALHVSHLTPRAFALALWDLIEAAGARTTVARWMVNEDASIHPMEASAHEQAWQHVLDLLNDLAESASADELPREFLIHLVQEALTQETLSTIPAGCNEVMVTDAHRAHGWTKRVVFLVGVTDGALPRRMHSTSLLSDDERVQFASWFGQSVGYTTEEAQLCERTVVYGALTRATEQLFVTYPLATADGKEVRPSAIIARLLDVFSGALVPVFWHGSVATDEGAAVITSRAQRGTDTALLATRASALLDVIQGLVRDRDRGMSVSPALHSLCAWLLAHDASRQQLGHALRGMSHRAVTRSLPQALATGLYGDDMHMNVYQLETFAACSYRHYAQFGLRLKTEDSGELTRAHRGTLIHDTLHLFVSEGMQDMDRWRQLSEEAVKAWMIDCFHSVLEGPSGLRWQRRADRLALAHEAQVVLEQAATVLTGHAQQGLFEPHALELSFGELADSNVVLPPVDVAPGVRVSLRGRVDRIDALTQNGQHMFRIVDYKSGDMDIDLYQVHHGLRLQLPLYAAVIEEASAKIFGQTSRPVALVYLPIRVKSQTELKPESQEMVLTQMRKGMQAKGLMVSERPVIEASDRRFASAGESPLFRKLFKRDGSFLATAPVLDPDDWTHLLAHARSRLTSFALRIHGGDIDIRPYRIGLQENACQYCQFAALCHIDPRSDATPFRRFPALKRDDVLALWRNQAAGMEDTNDGD